MEGDHIAHRESTQIVGLSALLVVGHPEDPAAAWISPAIAISICAGDAHMAAKRLQSLHSSPSDSTSPGPSHSPHLQEVDNNSAAIHHEVTGISSDHNNALTIIMPQI